MKKINPNKWIQLRKRAARNHPFCLSLMFDYSTTNLMTKVYGSSPIEQIHIFEKDMDYQFFPARIIDNFGKSIIQKIYKSPTFSSSLVVKAKKTANRMRDELNKLEKIKLEKISDTNLYKLYLKFVNYYRRFALFSIPLWILGEKSLSDKLKSILDRKKISRSKLATIFIVLSSSTTSSFVTLEELALLKIAQRVRRGLKIERDLKWLVKQYGFFIYDYSGPKVREVVDYLGEINNLIKKSNLTKEIFKRQNYFKKLKRQQQKIFKDLKLNRKEKNIVLALQRAAVLQDLRKKYNSLFNFKTEILLKEIGRRLGIDFQAVRYILPQEMVKVLKNRKVDKKLLGSRRRLCVIRSWDGKPRIYSGKEIKPFLVLLKDQQIEKASEIKGQVASRGWVKGKVSIIRNKEEIWKLKKGEILVTPMTMPDFAPAIQKCVAIITDEGGITCHAAIVSRELQKPCIIGTKIATKMLKDGDLVEVDANKGVVKILKKT